MSIVTLAERMTARELPESMPLRVVAIDGHGGAGKSTLAARFAAALGGAQVVHTDDFASWEQPLEWWPRLIEQMLQPFAEGRPARYQRFDWASNTLAEWIDVPIAPCLVLEGVSSSRREFRPYLSFAIWVETPREVCLARGIDRDGEEMRPQWERWMADEDRYIERDAPDRSADLVVAGTPVEGDPNDDLIVLRQVSTFDSGR